MFSKGERKKVTAPFFLFLMSYNLPWRLEGLVWLIPSKMRCRFESKCTKQRKNCTKIQAFSAHGEDQLRELTPHHSLPTHQVCFDAENFSRKKKAVKQINLQKDTAVVMQRKGTKTPMRLSCQAQTHKARHEQMPTMCSFTAAYEFY